MSEKKLGWGIISTANIAKWAVIPALQASNNGELLAVASRDHAKAETFASACGIPIFYGSYEEILDNDNIDAVYIPLPNSLHLEWVIKAAEKGKHILCEKPLALNAAECYQMKEAAESNGVKLMEAFMYRFHPQTEKVIQMVRSGQLGELKLIHSAFTFRLTNPRNIRLDPVLGGGSLMDVGCYCVNISRTVTGEEPVEVQAFANWAPSGVDAEMSGTLRFGNGVIAQFDSALTMERREVYEVAGTEAYLSVPGAFLPGMGDTIIWEHRGRGEPIAHTIAGVDEYQLMVEHFAGCVINDRPLRYTVDEAALNMRVIEALYQSAKNNGKPVQL